MVMVGCGSEATVIPVPVATTATGGAGGGADEGGRGGAGAGGMGGVGGAMCPADCGACGECVDGACEPRVGVCRGKAGPCDAIEACDGESLECPVDELFRDGYVPGSIGDFTCGAYACDGMSAECPEMCAVEADCAPGFGCTNDGACVAN